MGLRSIQCTGGKIGIAEESVRWDASSLEVQAVLTDDQMKTQLEVNAGRSLPAGVYVHKNRDGSTAVATFRSGVMPKTFKWPEDER